MWKNEWQFLESRAWSIEIWSGNSANLEKDRTKTLAEFPDHILNDCMLDTTVFNKMCSFWRSFLAPKHPIKYASIAVSPEIQYIITTRSNNRSFLRSMKTLLSNEAHQRLSWKFVERLAMDQGPWIYSILNRYFNIRFLKICCNQSKAKLNKIN